MPRGATDMSHVWAGRRAQARHSKLTRMVAELRAEGYIVIEPVDERKEPVTTQPQGR